MNVNRINALFQDAFLRIQAQNIEIQEQTDIETHNRFSRIFPKGARWRFWEIKRKNGSYVRHCYSVNKNCTGNYLYWRETYNAKTKEGKRDNYEASSNKSVIRQHALGAYKKQRGEK